MSGRHVVVDGSNIATEGRSLPSLAQLDEAVLEYKREFPDDVVTVVVDATFGHRIGEEERAPFDEAIAHNELVSPPAGAIGRGDAFLLRIAEKVGATVLSNDSFQEFHGEHEWLFNNGRLIGGKPVPDVGWVFTARTPVRGPKSREAVRTAKKAAKKPPAADRKVRKAIAVATEEAVKPDSPSARPRRRRATTPPAEPVNEPLTFIQFVAEHPLGSEVEGEVDSFSSHGTFVTVDGARCYVPLSGLADPPPRSAREVVKKSERRTFVIQALDPARRGIELALPGLARVSGTPTGETVEEEIRAGATAASRRQPAQRRPAQRRPAQRAAAAEPAAAEPAAAEPAAADSADEWAPDQAPAEQEPAAAAGKAPASRTTSKSPATRKGAAKKAATRKAAPKKAAPKKATADKAAPKKAAPKKAATRKATAEKATAKKATAQQAAAKKAPAKRTATKKATAKRTAAERAATPKVPAGGLPAPEAAPDG